MGFLTRAEYNELVDKLKKRVEKVHYELYVKVRITLDDKPGNGALTAAEKNRGRVIKYLLKESKISDPTELLVTANHMLNQSDTTDATAVIKKLRSQFSLKDALIEHKRAVKNALAA